MNPLLRFGVIADVQYADSDDRKAWYNPEKTRFYRNSLNQVEKAFHYWQDMNGSCGKVSFILQLGDLIDALNVTKCSQTAIDRTLKCFLNNPSLPTYHTVGNHELYNFNRKELNYLFKKYLFDCPAHQHHDLAHFRSSLGCLATSDQINSFELYYKFKPMNGIKFISIDTYDISVLGYDYEHSKYKLAAQILRHHHGHDNKDLWDTDTNLSDANKRFQASNGALSVEQLTWLDQELSESDLNGEMVIVFGHVGLHPQSCSWDSILWNYQEVIDCFERHRSVVAYFNGHAHNSGYARQNDIHYVVLHGIIETAPNTEAFTTVSLFPDRIVIDGQGVEQKFSINLEMRKFKFIDHVTKNYKTDYENEFEDRNFNDDDDDENDDSEKTGENSFRVGIMKPICDGHPSSDIHHQNVNIVEIEV